MHLDDERTQRLLHGELEPAGEDRAREHLAVCPDCRTRLDEARREEERIFALLGELDQPPSHRGLAALPRGRRPPGPRTAWRWAAGIFLGVVAASAAYAVPGSPLPALLGRLASRAESVQPPAERGPGPEEPARAGIAVPPGERLTVRFEGGNGDQTATVALSEGSEVVVRATEGSARFASDVDRLTVRTTGRARFEILIPRSSRSVLIMTGSRTLFRVDASRVTTRARRERDGRYTLPLGSP